MDKKDFSFFKSGPHEYIAPDREERFGNARGFHQTQAFWNRQAMGRQNSTILGITAAVGQGTDLISHRPTLDIAADGNNGSCDLQTQKVGCALWRRIKPFTLNYIGPVYTGGRHLD